VHKLVWSSQEGRREKVDELFEEGHNCEQDAIIYVRERKGSSDGIQEGDKNRD